MERAQRMHVALLKPSGIIYMRSVMELAMVCTTRGRNSDAPSATPIATALPALLMLPHTSGSKANAPHSTSIWVPIGRPRFHTSPA
eukprot:scaffold2804_cov371-Prasinococcus_capsulatus_cf.AAC.10